MQEWRGSDCGSEKGERVARAVVVGSLNHWVDILLSLVVQS